MTTALIRRSRRSAAESGATAVEYALMVGLIALVIIAAVTTIGVNLSAFFADAATKI
jgi:pilus assembly protein Flp/PilA